MIQNRILQLKITHAKTVIPSSTVSVYPDSKRIYFGESDSFMEKESTFRFCAGGNRLRGKSLTLAPLLRNIIQLMDLSTVVSGLKEMLAQSFLIRVFISEMKIQLRYLYV